MRYNRDSGRYSRDTVAILDVQQFLRCPYSPVGLLFQRAQLRSAWSAALRDKRDRRGRWVRRPEARRRQAELHELRRARQDLVHSGVLHNTSFAQDFRAFTYGSREIRSTR